MRRLTAGVWLVLLACQGPPPPPEPIRRALDTGVQALVATGAAWEFLDEGADPGADWQTAPAASTWKLGLAPLGYGQGDEATRVSFGTDPARKPLANQYRVRFDVPDPARVLGLRLRILHDDGAVAYLGGQEIYRRNLPSGPLGRDTPATASAAPALVEQEVNPRLLRAGRNVLAVEVHQDGPASASHRFDLALDASQEVAVTRGPYLQSGAATQVTVRWRLAPAFAGRLWWGTSPGALTNVLDDPATAVDHAVTITGLAPGTRYHYAVGTPGAPLAGGAMGFSFVTPPAAGSAGPTRIWALGDSGTGNENAARVRDAYRKHTGDRATDVWLMLGDNAYPRGTDAEYQRALFDFFPEWLRSVSLWPALGNADVLCCESRPESAPYLDVFTLPTKGEAGGAPSGSELYYAFDHGDIHVVVLDSKLSSRDPQGPMLTWLRRDLAASTRPWLIAVWHHPPYTRGEHDSDAEVEHFKMRENALPILDQHGVDLVLGGHSHSYERSMLLAGHYGMSGTLAPAMKKDPGTGRAAETGPYRKTAGPNGGAVYVVLGNSGQLSPGPLNHPAMVVSALALGSLVVDVNGRQLDATFLRDTGEVGDQFTIIKMPAAPGSDGAAPEAGVAPDAGPDGDGAGGNGGGDGCSCHVGGRRGDSPLFLLLILGSALLGRVQRRRSPCVHPLSS